MVLAVPVLYHPTPSYLGLDLFWCFFHLTDDALSKDLKMRDLEAPLVVDQRWERSPRPGSTQPLTPPQSSLSLSFTS